MARTAVDPHAWFAGSLQRLMKHCGVPSPRALASFAKITDPHINHLAPTTLNNLLDPARQAERPEWETIEALIVACVAWAYRKRTDEPLRPGLDEVACRALEVREWKTRHEDLLSLLKHPAGTPGQPEPTVRVGWPPVLDERFQPRLVLTSSLGVTEAASDPVVRTQVLVGTGGVGKTQLAADYAWTHWRDPRLRLVIWVSARSRDTIVTAYADAAHDLVEDAPSDPESAAQKLLNWCAGDKGRWLIVLDDLQHLKDLHDLWPPAAPRGQVIVTTRRRDPALARPERKLIDVGVFSEQEAYAYLTAKVAEHPALLGGPAELKGLARDLGYLPLALAHAIAYVINRPVLLDLSVDLMTIPGYRSRLAEQHRRLDDLLPTLDELADGYNRTVAATFALSLDLANTMRPVGMAGPVMHVASLLDPAGSPLVLFGISALREHWSTTLDRDVGSDDVEEALGMLHRLSLITLDTQAPHREVRVHAVVQRTTRDGFRGRPDNSATVRVTADALLAIWPQVERDQALAAALRSNTTALHTVASDALWTPNGHAVLFRTGTSLGEAGLLAAAITHFSQLRTLAKTRLRSDHPDTLTARHNLAHWQGHAGDLAGSAAVLADLLDDVVKVFGPDHQHVLTTRHNIIYRLGEAGDATWAGAALSDLLDDMVRVFGRDHPSTLLTRHNMAYMRGEAGDPEGAAAAFADLLTDKLRVFGRDHPYTLLTRHNMAQSRGEAGDPEGAATAFADLLTDKLRILGPEHPDTLMTRHNVAYWHAEAGDPASASAAFADLLADQLRVFGPDHPDTLLTRHSVAYWQGRAGDPAGALAAFVDVLGDRLRVLGPDHPDTLKTRHSVAYWQGRAGDPAGALAAFVDVLGDRLRVLGPDHPDTLLTRYNIARWRGEAGDPAAAVAAFADLLADQLRVRGPDHPDTLAAQVALKEWQPKA
ncbi:tetratricopeptide repeat protein [Amycolatopsis sp. cg9]|uniref:tetratricopeptide repeat protein n=1 Tax=Amycolatopsis sp. cg9 TaxID=3238801 RepID=UPI0035253848